MLCLVLLGVDDGVDQVLRRWARILSHAATGLLELVTSYLLKTIALA
jgi:hypothetical protein